MPAQSRSTLLAARLADTWNEGWQWLSDHTTQIVIAAVLGALVAIGLLGLKWLGRRIARRNADANHWPRIIGNALSKIRLWFIAAIAARVVASYAHAPDDIAQTVYFVFVVAATLQAAVFVREVALGLIEYRAAGHQGLVNALGILRVLITFTLFAVAVILILSNLGVNVTGLIAGLGIGGIAIGLAAQGIFKDLFAALSILFDRPFAIGDLIKFGDVTGRVETIGLKTTRIRSLDGEEVIMGNDKLLDQLVRNYHAIESRRIVITIPLHYSNPPARLASVCTELKGVMEAIEHCRFDHALLTDCRDNAVSLELLLYATTGDAAVRDRVRHQAIVATLTALDAREIGISYQASDKPA